MHSQASAAAVRPSPELLHCLPPTPLAQTHARTLPHWQAAASELQRLSASREGLVARVAALNSELGSLVAQEQDLLGQQLEGEASRHAAPCLRAATRSVGACAPRQRARLLAMPCICARSCMQGGRV